MLQRNVVIFSVGLGVGVIVDATMFSSPVAIELKSNEPLCIETIKEVIVYRDAPSESCIEDKNLTILKKIAFKKNNEEVNSSKEIEVLLSSIELEFAKLLKDDLFSEAMNLYIEADDEILDNLQSILLGYFQRISVSKPLITIEQMLEFQSIAIDSNRVLMMLVELYKTRKSYNEAILLLSEMIQLNDTGKTIGLISNLLLTSTTYIKMLTDSQSLNNIVTFLEERITFGIEPVFYTLLLAQHYINQHQYLKSHEALLTINFEEKYKVKTEELIALVEKKIELNEAYIYKIPLERSGEHFIVQVYVNYTPLRLLLDTGASYTTIRQDKLVNLTVARENVRFSTAGGIVYNHIYRAESFSVGEITISNFKISGSRYYDDDDDGLLGMNFLRKFDFKIDQTDNILYLTKRE